MKGSGFDSSMGCRMISEVWRFGLGSLRASRRIIEGLFLLRCCGQPQRETRAGATHSFQIHAAHVLGFYDRLSRAISPPPRLVTVMTSLSRGMYTDYEMELLVSTSSKNSLQSALDSHATTET